MFLYRGTATFTKGKDHNNYINSFHGSGIFSKVLRGSQRFNLILFTLVTSLGIRGREVDGVGSVVMRVRKYFFLNTQMLDNTKCLGVGG